MVLERIVSITTHHGAPGERAPPSPRDPTRRAVTRARSRSARAPPPSPSRRAARSSSLTDHAHSQARPSHLVAPLFSPSSVRVCVCSTANRSPDGGGVARNEPQHKNTRRTKPFAQNETGSSVLPGVRRRVRPADQDAGRDPRALRPRLVRSFAIELALDAREICRLLGGSA